MKGVVLAGGLGTRLDPLTRVTNKHLLPVYDLPMILHPIGALRDAGMREIMIVTGGPFAQEVPRVLGGGHEFGVTLSYACQEGVGGIADALAYAEGFAAGGRLCVVLGDNIFGHAGEPPDTRDARDARDARDMTDGHEATPAGGPLGPYVRAFAQQEEGARVVLRPVDDARGLGVARLAAGRVREIIEKPERPPSAFAVTGVYFYCSGVFDIIREVGPSARGEREITDVNNAYCRAGTMEHSVHTGWWSDAGTFDGLLASAGYIAGERRAASRKDGYGAVSAGGGEA